MCWGSRTRQPTCRNSRSAALRLDLDQPATVVPNLDHVLAGIGAVDVVPHERVAPALVAGDGLMFVGAPATRRPDGILAP